MIEFRWVEVDPCDDIAEHAVLNCARMNDDISEVINYTSVLQWRTEKWKDEWGATVWSDWQTVPFDDSVTL